MIRVEGLNDHTPVRALHAAIREIAPDLVDAYDPTRADLTVWPRRTDIPDSEESATPDAWYDLWWTHSTVTYLEPWDEEDEALDIRHARISRIRSVPPPPRIPLEQRLEAAPPVTLDGLSEEQIRMWGGPGAVRETLEGRQRTALEYDHSVEAYDWAALAERIVEIARGLTPPRLDAGQRAQVAAARLLEARRRLEAARQAMSAHLTNAREAGHGDIADALEEMLPEIDPGAAVDILGMA